jgi:hypothetical protein
VSALGAGITETRSLGKIPWKPISASGLLTEDDSTSISVLYSSEYVNGNGYYLYSDEVGKQKNNVLCENNNTLKFPSFAGDSKAGTFGWFLSLWWYVFNIMPFNM